MERAPAGRQGAQSEGPMLVLAGVDEAGFGPLLGSLAIGWSVLSVPASASDPWRSLRGTVARTPRSRARLVVADSKLLFRRNARGARRLEATVLSFLAQLERSRPIPSDPARLCFGPLAPDPSFLRAHPWYARLPRLPQHGEPRAIELSAALLARSLARAGAALLDAGVRLVPAGELNASYARTGNKSLTLWSLVLEVLRRLWSQHRAARLCATVDRLGGRRRYGELLEHGFPEACVHVQAEGPERSAYRLEARDGCGRMELEFRVRSERASFPVALASCIAKYARELEMAAFNAYFSELEPALRPTAGYRGDGARWLAEARSAIERSGLPAEVLVRAR